MVLVEVGGYRLSVEVSGSGPPVVFLSALGEPGSVWTPVRQRMTERATVVVYDRGGVGSSDGVPEPDMARPYSWFARELAAMLDTLELNEPAILVGHSFGCLVARVFAATDPDRVRGLVLAEASQPQLTLWDGDDGYLQDGARTDATAIDRVRGAREIVPLFHVAGRPWSSQGRLGDG